MSRDCLESPERASQLLLLDRLSTLLLAKRSRVLNLALLLSGLRLAISCAGGLSVIRIVLYLLIHLQPEEKTMTDIPHGLT
ncbi:MAG: hypothetical protein ACREP9_08250, partial [Candidatus Dormibacteraceae bacterium]